MADLDGKSYWGSLQARRINRRRTLAGGATFLTGGIALGLVGCSSSNNNSKSNANNSAATQAATQASGGSPTSAATRAAGGASPVAGGSPAAGGGATAAATLVPAGNFKTGGTIQAFITGAGNLDPVANTSYRSQWYAGFHYSRLFRFASSPDPKLALSRQPVGDLVTGYEATPDALTYTMKLRPDAVFHPPLSRPLTSADVLASYKYFTTNPQNSNSGVYTPIVDSLTAPDANTIVFKLKQPYAPFINKLGNTQYLWIMSADAVGGKIDPSQQAIGTGPWIYANGTPTAVTWKKNPNYFIKGIPYADGAVLNVIPDTSTLEAQFQAGAIDVLNAGSPPPSDVDAIKKAVPKATTIEYTPAGLNFLFFSNVTDPNSPFKDPRMRQAASLAIDRKGLIDLEYNGHGAWDNIVPPGLGKWYLDPLGKDIGDSGKYFKQDKQAAKQLIQAAGHANTQIKYLYPNNAYGDLFNSQADAIRGMLSDAGFQLSVVTVDYLKDYINNGQGIFNKGAPPNTIVCALQSAFTDPDDYLSGMLTKNGNRNHDLLDDPDLLAAVTKQQQELDENKRVQLVYQVQQMHAALMYYPPIVYTNYINMIQPWVQNYFVCDDYNLATEEFAYMSVNNK
jgi:peptide/nickel transport system substrate-binding protein